MLSRWNLPIKTVDLRIGFFLFSIPLLLALVGCGRHGDVEAAEAAPPPNVVTVAEPNLFTVDHPEQFPLATATERPNNCGRPQE